MAILGGIFSSGKKEHKKKREKRDAPQSPSTLKKHRSPRNSTSPTISPVCDECEAEQRMHEQFMLTSPPLGATSPVGMKSMESFASSSYSRATVPQLPSLYFGRGPSSVRGEEDRESIAAVSLASPVSSRTHSRPYDTVSSNRSVTSTLVPPPSRTALFSGSAYARSRSSDAAMSDHDHPPPSMSTHSLPVDISSHTQQQRHPIRLDQISTSPPQISNKKQSRPSSPLATKSKDKEKSSGGMFSFIRDRKKSQPALEAAASARQRSSLDRQQSPPQPVPLKGDLLPLDDPDRSDLPPLLPPIALDHFVHPSTEKGFVPPKRPNHQAKMTASSSEFEKSKKSKKKSQPLEAEDPVSPSSSFNLVSFRNVTSGSQDPHSPIDLPPPDLTSRSRSRLDSVGSDGSAAITAGAFRQAQARRSTTNLVETGVTTPGRRSLSNDPANPRRPSLEGSVLLNTRSPSPFGHQAQQMPLPGAPAPPPSAPLLVSTSTAAGGGFRIGSEPPPRPPRNRPPGPAISTSDLLGSKSQPNTPAKMSSSNLFSNVDTTETESESEDSESQTESGSEGEEESESGSDSSSEEESEEEDDDDDEPLAHQVRLVGAKKPVDRKTTITQRSASANITGSGFNGKRSKLNPNVNARPQPAGGPHPRAASMPLEAMVLKNPPPRTSSLNVNAVSSSPVRPASSGDLLVGSKSGMLEVPSHTPRKRSVSPIGPETKGTSPYRDDDRRSDKNSSSPHYSSSTVKPQHSSNTPGTVRSKKALAQPSQGSDSEESESDDSVESEDIPLGIKRSTSAMVLGKPTPGVAFTTSKSDLGHGGMMSSAKSDASHGGKRNFSSSSSVMTTSNGSPPRHRKTPSKASSQGLVDLASPSTFDAPRNQTKGSHAGPINTHHRTPQQPLKSAMRPGSSLNGHSSSSNNSPTSTNGNPQNKWLSAPLSSPNSSLLSTPATSIFSQPPSRPFAVPAFGYSSSPNGSSIGDSSSGKMPLTPREGSEASSGVSSGDRRFNGNPQRGHARKGSVTFEEPNGKGGNNGDSEERRKERRRSEAKQAIQMGNAINGPLPDVDVDNESIYSGSNHHHSQNQVNPMNMGMPGANMPMGMGSPWEWNQQQMLMMLANQSMNTLPGIGVPSFMPQAGAGGQQQQGNVDPAAFLSAHQQAMLYAKHTFQLAIAQQAMQAAGEEWERSSHAGGSVMNGMGGGGTPLMGMGMNMPMGMSPLGMGMMGMPGMMFPSAPASVYGGSVAGSVYGGGSGSRLGVPVPRSGQSDIGLGSPPNAGKQRPRTRTASGVGSLPLQHQRNQNQNQGIPRKPSPPSSWKKS